MSERLGINYTEPTVCHGLTVAYIDFNKALEYVYHTKLFFFRFAQYGIQGELYYGWKSFSVFTDRTYKTRV